MKGKQQAGHDGLSRREILMGVGTVAAGLPAAQMATAGTHVSSTETDARITD